jgi:hypothetical protein
MATNERVTVTLPVQLVADIEHFERNRSRFILEAVERELVRRRREGLQQSLSKPHPEASDLAETGLAEWAAGLPAGDESPVDLSTGRAVQWVEVQGWIERST